MSAYAFNKTLCVVAIVAAVALAFLNGFPIPAALAFGVEQAVVYLGIWGFARICRDHPTASAIIATAVIATFAISVPAIHMLRPSPGPHMIGPVPLLLFGQVLVALMLCYLGYGIVEAARTRECNPGSWRGKLTVMLLLSPVVFVMLGLAATFMSQ